MLGVAFEDTGNFGEAQRCYERSLLILEHDLSHTSEYSAALQNLGRLNTELGQLQAAESMWLKALHLRQQLGDHAATTGSLTDLAGLALARNNTKQARKYLKQAADESKLADDLIDGDFALLAETRGWLALAERRAAEAVQQYQLALEFCERANGKQHWLTGWEHMLRGKAYAQEGDTQHALADMQQGLTILEHTLGRKNPKYFISEIAYSQVLEQSGSHTEAVRLKTAAEQASKEFYGAQCVGCTINIAAFR